MESPIGNEAIKKVAAQSIENAQCTLKHSARSFGFREVFNFDILSTAIDGAKRPLHEEKDLDLIDLIDWFSSISMNSCGIQLGLSLRPFK